MFREMDMKKKTARRIVCREIESAKATIPGKVDAMFKNYTTVEEKGVGRQSDKR